MDLIEFIQGTCLAMCPEKERVMREREGLLHILEIDENYKHLRRPKADPAKIIKSFSRSAAGQNMSDPSLLRPGPVLLCTLRYIVTKVLTRTDINWHVLYEFAFDRMRAIRQDIVIQRLNVLTTIQLLEPIARFHVYSAQRLVESSPSQFDEKLNNQHLQEVLKILLVCYDELERHHDLSAGDTIDEQLSKMLLNDNRPEIEALYLLFNLGDHSALVRALSLPQNVRQSKEVRTALNVSMSWYSNNYTRTTSLMRELPPLFAIAALCNLRILKKKTLKIMSAAYNSKTLTFPGVELQDILLYNNTDKLRNDCKLFGLTVTNGNIQFDKSSFNDETKLATPEMFYDVKTLQKLLPSCILH